MPSAVSNTYHSANNRRQIEQRQLSWDNCNGDVTQTWSQRVFVPPLFHDHRRCRNYPENFI